MVTTGSCLAAFGYKAFEYWMIPRERRAATIALDRIEDVRNSGGPKDVTYQVKKAKAKKAVESAEAAAITMHDKETALWLGEDLSSATFEKEFTPPHPLPTELRGRCRIRESRQRIRFGSIKRIQKIDR